MRTSWVEICVSSLSDSITWFSEVLQFEVVDRDSHFASLQRGETTILLGTDHGPYWSPEHARIPDPGQRGGGVEIVLLVEGIEEVYRNARERGGEIVRPLESKPWGMNQFWVRHPDGFLLRPAERIKKDAPRSRPPGRGRRTPRRDDPSAIRVTRSKRRVPKA